VCYTRTMQTKKCSKCNQVVSVKEFYPHKKTKSGLQSWCKDCSRKSNRENRKPSTPEQKKAAIERQRKRYQADPQRHKSWVIKWKYNITKEEYDDIFIKQGESCAICGTKESGGKGWCIDHDHSCCPDGNSCGKCVRGILCTRCNMGLGYLQDSEDVLLSAIRYLEENQNV